MSEGERRVEVQNGVGLLSSGSFVDKITPEWFTPEFWAERVQSLETGGRGSVRLFYTGEQ